MTWLLGFQIVSIVFCWIATGCVFRHVRRMRAHYEQMRVQSIEREQSYQRIYAEYIELRTLYRARLGLSDDATEDEERLH